LLEEFLKHFFLRIFGFSKIRKITSFVWIVSFSSPKMKIGTKLKMIKKLCILFGICLFSITFVLNFWISSQKQSKSSNFYFEKFWVYWGKITTFGRNEIWAINHLNRWLMNLRPQMHFEIRKSLNPKFSKKWIMGQKMARNPWPYDWEIKILNKGINPRRDLFWSSHRRKSH